MMPTLPPLFASAIARFTATVVFPTPPLPAPTAMTFFTPGNDCRGPSGPGRFAPSRAQLHVHRAHARQLHHSRSRLIAHLILHRTRRRGELDRERDAIALDLQILDEPEADDVAVEIRIRDDI